jgi:hypothetical protein
VGSKREGKSTALARSPERLARLPVQVTRRRRSGASQSRYLRSAHMVKVGCGFDEKAFAGVVDPAHGG